MHAIRSDVFKLCRRWVMNDDGQARNKEVKNVFILWRELNDQQWSSFHCFSHFKRGTSFFWKTCFIYTSDGMNPRRVWWQLDSYKEECFDLRSQDYIKTHVLGYNLWYPFMIATLLLVIRNYIWYHSQKTTMLLVQ